MTVLDESNDELFDEDIDSNSIEAEDENSEINEPFDPTKIRVNTRPMTIDLVLSRIKHGELELQPDFQRHPGIWTLVGQSRFIESMLLRIPLPAFYMYATDDNKWLVIDGLQRLTAINEFYNNKLCLTGLEYLTDLNGKKYEEIPRNYQRRILETQIIVYEIERGTPPEVKFSVFMRINSWGLTLSSQEMRNALYQGKATQLLKKLADSEIFKEVIQITKRVQEGREDQEFILRFLAFYLASYKDYKAKTLDTFLNNTMDNINKMNNQQLQKIENDFKEGIETSYQIFGEYAFRKRSKTNLERKSQLNKALFETWMVNLCQLDQSQKDIILEKKEELNNKFIDLMEEDEQFMKSISQGTGKIAQVQYRFSCIENLIKEVLS